jgi:hypothetical protein
LRHRIVGRRVHDYTLGDKTIRRQKDLERDTQDHRCTVHLIEKDSLPTALDVAGRRARDSESFGKRVLLPTLLAPHLL